MKKLLICLLLLTACSPEAEKNDFAYQEIPTRNFTLRSWQKVTDANAAYKIYLEDTTPKQSEEFTSLIQRLAFNDPAPNVIYLERPCLYNEGICSDRHRESARFAPEIINAVYEAVTQIGGNRPLILVGYDGGAQITGLVAAAKPGLNIKKMITIAGIFDHLALARYHSRAPLAESMNLESYRSRYLTLPQIHYAGGQDWENPPYLIEEFVGEKNLIMIETASHTDGWQIIFPLIWQEK